MVFQVMDKGVSERQLHLFPALEHYGQIELFSPDVPGGVCSPEGVKGVADSNVFRVCCDRVPQCVHWRECWRYDIVSKLKSIHDGKD